jgi:hypothetical protein
MLFGKTVAVCSENRTEHTDTVRISQETDRVSTREPNRLMLCGETVAVYYEKRTEYTDTLCDNPYLTGNTYILCGQSVPHRDIDTMCGQNVGFRYLKEYVHIVSIWL